MLVATYSLRSLRSTGLLSYDGGVRLCGLREFFAQPSAKLITGEADLLHRVAFADGDGLVF